MPTWSYLTGWQTSPEWPCSATVVYISHNGHFKEGTNQLLTPGVLTFHISVHAILHSSLPFTFCHKLSSTGLAVLLADRWPAQLMIYYVYSTMVDEIFFSCRTSLFIAFEPKSGLWHISIIDLSASDVINCHLETLTGWYVTHGRLCQTSGPSYRNWTENKQKVWSQLVLTNREDHVCSWHCVLDRGLTKGCFINHREVHSPF